MGGTKPLVPRGKGSMGARPVPRKKPRTSATSGPSGTSGAGSRPGPGGAELLRREVEGDALQPMQINRLECAFEAFSHPASRLAICIAGGGCPAQPWLWLRRSPSQTACVSICSCLPDTTATARVLFAEPRNVRRTAHPSPRASARARPANPPSSHFQVQLWWNKHKREAEEAARSLAAGALLWPTYELENSPTQNRPRRASATAPTPYKSDALSALAAVVAQTSMCTD